MWLHVGAEISVSGFRAGRGGAFGRAYGKQEIDPTMSVTEKHTAGCCHTRALAVAGGGNFGQITQLLGHRAKIDRVDLRTALPENNFLGTAGKQILCKHSITQ
jgi:hypothetical protein